MMKRRLFLFFSTAVLLAVFSTSVSIEVSAEEEGEKKTEPRVENINPVYDFGKVYRGETIQHTFTIRNSGDDYLIIGEISRDCGCTIAEVDRNSLAPGEELPINVMVSTKLLDAGEIDKSVRLSTNDKLEPETVLTIRGELLVTANLEPSIIEIEGIKPGDKIPEQIVKITPVEGFDLKIRDMKVNSDLVSVKLMPTDDSGEFRVAVNVSSETTKSVIAAGIRIFTNLEEEPVLRLPVRVVMDQPYIVIPTNINFTGIRSEFEGKLAYNVVIKNNEGEPLEILDVKTEDEFIKCTLMTVEEGKKYRLNVALLPGFPESGYTGRVTVFTNNKLYPEREIVVRVNRPKKDAGQKTGK